MLFEFQLLHTKELGDIILEIFRLRKIIYKKSKPLYEEASQDEKKYKEQFVEDSKKKVFDLTEDEKVELKKRFRKATTYCHPDKVSLEYEEAAREIFVELKEAYDSNDLSRVISIEKSLSQGNFKPKSETVDEKELLKANINAYKIKIEKIRNEIQRIKEDDSYKTISSISDWGEYFESTRKKLNMELNYLNKEVKES